MMLIMIAIIAFLLGAWAVLTVQKLASQTNVAPNDEVDLSPLHDDSIAPDRQSSRIIEGEYESHSAKK